MKTALITGAARGLGCETGRQLSELGWRVITTGRLELDVTDDQSVKRAASEVPELDVLINNAAIIDDNDRDILTVPIELVARTLANNALGALRVAQAFAPQLTKSSSGRIINVSSSNAQLRDINTLFPAYSLSKATLNAVTCLLAATLKGIAVNAVCPGWCRTHMGARGGIAPRSVEQGASGIVWLATDAPQDKTGLFWRDKEIIPW